MDIVIYRLNCCNQIYGGNSLQSPKSRFFFNQILGKKQTKKAKKFKLNILNKLKRFFTGLMFKHINLELQKCKNPL